MCCPREKVEERLEGVYLLRMRLHTGHGGAEVLLPKKCGLFLELCA